MSDRPDSELFANPPAEFRGAPFWSWNSRLEPDRLRREIADMSEAGMGGFFMHSRYGLKTPYLSESWWQCIDACVDEAASRHIKAYFYDEDRWPSGAAGGLVTRGRPELQMKAMEGVWDNAIHEDATVAARFAVTFADAQAQTMDSYRRLADGEEPGPGETLLTFAWRCQDADPWHNDGTYLDTLNPEAVAEFLRITHDQYAARHGQHFGKLIGAMFTDEPEYGPTHYDVRPGTTAFTWTTSVPEAFQARCGYDLLDHLPEMVFRTAGREFSTVRYDFRQTVTSLFEQAFSSQYGRWCEQHNLPMTGHYNAEQDLYSQARATGAVMVHYQHQQWPGIDILTDKCKELTTAKQCTSVADQLGKQRVLSEMYGCTGWDWPLRRHKYIGDWQYACGVNFRCQHLTHYSLAGGAKRDYPASISAHSPWWKYYRSVEDYFGRLSYTLTRGRPLRDVLVLHPVRSGWGLYTNHRPLDSATLNTIDKQLTELIFQLSGGHYDWDFGDEDVLAGHGSVEDSRLRIGQMTYRLVIIPPCTTLKGSTVEMLERFAAAGGQVLQVGQAPDRIDGRETDRDLSALANAGRVNGSGAVIGAIEAMLERRVSIRLAGSDTELPSCWYMLRKVDGGRLLFIHSHDDSEPANVTVSAEGQAPAVLWDAATGRRLALKTKSDGNGRVEFDLELPAVGSALVSLGVDASDAEPLPVRPEPRSVQKFDGAFDIELAEPNTAPLDYCQFRFEGEDWSQPMPVLLADAKIRERFGLGTRFGREHQPWYLYETGAVDTAPRGRCELRWTFHVTDLPASCDLAIERPGDFELTLNGKPIGSPQGWWVDEDIQTIDIVGLLQEGENEIVSRFDYRPTMELEDVYLVGPFGVARRDETQPRRPGNITLTAPPRQLQLGSWVGQGLDHYSGAVFYRLKIARPPQGRLMIRLPGLEATAAAVHVGDATMPLVFPPYEADITDALVEGLTEVRIEVIGGRRNILGPLHVPWESWTGPKQFDPRNEKWTDDYLLTDHGLCQPVEVVIF
jgi:hypothetical protein